MERLEARILNLVEYYSNYQELMKKLQVKNKLQ